MFEKNKRYVTAGIHTELPLELQFFIWDIIEKQLEMPLDYLQVFDLRKDESGILILHSQEEPDYKREFYLNNSEVKLLRECTVFVIDDGDVSTMLFAEEY